MFKKRCSTVEEAFEQSGKPFEESMSLFGGFGKSKKNFGSRRREFAFTAKHALFAVTSLAILAAAATALHFFLDRKHAKTKQTVR